MSVAVAVAGSTNAGEVSVHCCVTALNVGARPGSAVAVPFTVSTADPGTNAASSSTSVRLSTIWTSFTAPVLRGWLTTATLAVTVAPGSTWVVGAGVPVFVSA